MSATAPVVVAGARSTTNTADQSIKVRDVEAKINLLQPYFFPLQWFRATKLFKEFATGGDKSKTEWNEDKYLPDSVTATNGITGGGTTETFVVSGNYFKVYDTILAENSNELLLVTAVTVAAGTVTVKKVGAGNITAVAAGKILMRLANAFPEGAAKQTSLTTLTVPKYCYCQIVKKAVQMTGREQAADTYGDGWKYQWVKASLEVKEEMERSWVLNGPSYLDSALDITYSAGMRGSFTTNLMEYTGDLDEVELDDAILQVVNQGTAENSGMIMIMGGGTILNNINKFLKARYQIIQDSANFKLNTYGVATTYEKKEPHFVDYQHLSTVVRVFWNPQLKNAYAKEAAIYDPRMISMPYMKPDEDGVRKMRQELAIKTPGTDVKEGQILFDQGLKIKLEETGGWLRPKA